MMGRGAGGGPKGAPPKKVDRETSIKTAKRVLAYVTQVYRPQFYLVLFLIVLSSFAGVAGAMFLEILIDQHIIPLIGIENPVFTPLLMTLGVMGIIYLVGVFSNLIFNRLMVTISQGVQKTIRDELFEHMQTLPVSYLDQNAQGDLMSRFTNDVDALRTLLGQGIPVVFSTLITLLLTFMAMLYTSFILTVIVVIMITLNLFSIGKLSKLSGKYFGEQQAKVGKLNAHIEEMISNQKVIKVFNHEATAKVDFGAINKEVEEASGQANKYANMFLPIMLNLGSLQYVVVAIVGGAFAINAMFGITLGTIAAFLQLSRSFTLPLGNLAMQINGIVMAVAGASRIFEILDKTPEQDNGHVTLEKIAGAWTWKDGETLIPVKGDIVLENVTFGYNEEKMVLQNIQLTAHPGEKIAIVGATGAGKTTITNLINRFYDLQGGRILYDGIDIAKINKPDLRFSLGMVLQDTVLFTDTVLENIRYGNLSATDEEVIEAAKRANAHSFIELLPEGYHTVLESAGSRLSQGQRQLLAIARAAVANPPVMVLDEATSSIDTRTEIIVQKGMDALMAGRTVFVIAHRLSTVKNAQAIVVLDKGQIIELGTHQELLEQKGVYHKMYSGGLSFDD